MRIDVGNERYLSMKLNKFLKIILENSFISYDFLNLIDFILKLHKIIKKLVMLNLNYTLNLDF